MNKRQCSFQGGVIQTGNLKVVVTIENPEKWLSTKEKAIAYIYQNVLPLQQNIAYPTKESLQPYFWGTKPTTMAEAGCTLNATQNHILALVVGLEVGTHINPYGHDFQHKANQVSNLNIYVSNLIDALDEFGIKQDVYVTTSIAPSNCDEENNNCGGILEILPMKNGMYALNTQDYNINGIDVNFSQSYEALKTIYNQHYDSNPIGVLLSLYHYWQYFPGEDLGNYSANDWINAIEIRHELIVDAVQKNQGLQNLPLSIGEIGWPSDGNNACDGSPNMPSLATQTKLLQAAYDWGINDTDSIAPIVLFWRLFQIDDDAAMVINCYKDNPEFYYGLLPGGLENLYSTDYPVPNAQSDFPDFKNAGTPEPTPQPTPEPTPQPTPEPTPQPTPEPTPQPTPEPTPEPTPQPTPEPTPQPTPEPTPQPTPEPTSVTMYCPDMEPAENIGWLMNDVGQPINNAGYQYMMLKIASEADAPGEKTYGYSDEAVTVQSGIADDGNYPKLICKYSYNDGTTTYFMSAPVMIKAIVAQ
jgi:hypothetical protein